ncbi:unnamed protein product [Caretta caretta]
MTSQQDLRSRRRDGEPGGAGEREVKKCIVGSVVFPPASISHRPLRGLGTFRFQDQSPVRPEAEVAVGSTALSARERCGRYGMTSHFIYFLEKKKRGAKSITCLLAEDGTPLTDPEKMQERTRAFYLFSPDPPDANACRLLRDDLPMVRTGNQDWLKLPLTLAKFQEAVYQMPTNKSPDINGLTVDCYQMFCEVINLDLVIN